MHILRFLVIFVRYVFKKFSLDLVSIALQKFSDFVSFTFSARNLQFLNKMFMEFEKKHNKLFLEINNFLSYISLLPLITCNSNLTLRCGWILKDGVRSDCVEIEQHLTYRWYKYIGETRIILLCGFYNIWEHLVIDLLDWGEIVKYKRYKKKEKKEVENLATSHEHILNKMFL